jgi:hypothetical protein
MPLTVGATVAVKVSVWFTIEVGDEEITVVVVDVVLTVCAAEPWPPVKFESPVYTAVIV